MAVLPSVGPGRAEGDRGAHNPCGAVKVMVIGEAVDRCQDGADATLGWFLHPLSAQSARRRTGSGCRQTDGSVWARPNQRATVIAGGTP